MSKLVTAKQMAEILGISERRVNQIVKENELFFKEPNGKFDTEANIERYYKNKFIGNKVDYDKEHALLEATKREKAEIELELLKGSLLNAEEVEQEMANMILTCKSRLLSIPTKCATKVIGQKTLSMIVETIRDEIYEALNELKEMPAPRSDDNADAEDT